MKNGSRIFDNLLETGIELDSDEMNGKDQPESLWMLAHRGWST
ncbi:MAG TPA: hypothetical protein VJK54_00605 [Chthoniobacterales bacterium]|nr:hypothetical protein [Chthoniobacterales bacterium]